MHLQSVEMKLRNLYEKWEYWTKKNMKIADLDLIFVAVNVETGQKAKNEENSDTELERFEYVETIAYSDSKIQK